MRKFTQLNRMRNMGFVFTSIALTTGLSLMGQTPSYLPSANLKAWYSFSGNTNDGSGNGLNGTSSAPTYTTDRFGTTNAAFQFNGTNNQVVVPHNTNLNVYPITISLWFKTDPTFNGGYPIAKYINASWNGWQIGIGNNGPNSASVAPHYLRSDNPCTGVIEGYSICGNPVGMNYTGALNDGNWHNLVFRIDSWGGYLFIDGIQVSQQAWIGTPGFVTTLTSMLIGKDFEGAVDDIAIWHDALSNQTITEIAQSACTGTPTVYATNSSLPTVATGNSTTLSLNNATNENGMSYQWQSADDANFTVNVTNLGTGFTQVVLPTSSKYYRCRVTCSNSALFSFSTPVFVPLVSMCNGPSVTASPSSICPGETSNLSATCIAGGFSGLYAPGNWNQSNSPGDNGSVNTSLSPSSITLTSSNAGMGIGASSLSYAITVPFTGNISFNWNYSTSDLASSDIPNYAINGVVAGPIPGFDINAGNAAQSGSASIPVNAGDVFSFVFQSTDNNPLAANFTVSSFVGPEFPLVVWYTSPSGGVSIGSSLASANFAVNPTTTTTYYAEIQNGAYISPVRIPITVNTSNSLCNYFCGPGNSLHDNGNLQEFQQGVGAGGANVSILTSGTYGTFGFGANNAASQKISDDFVVTGCWTPNSLTFYTYQTGSSTTSTITGVPILELWNTMPDNSGAPIATSTANPITNNVWTGIYRVLSSDVQNTQRPVMGVTVNWPANFPSTLSAGTYWLVWNFEGSLGSGPWCPPVSISSTGNGRQYNGGWITPLDGVSNLPAEFPFTVCGSASCNYTWTGTVSADWHTAGNWNPAVVPGAASNALIPDVSLASGNFPFISASPVSINNLTINAGASVNVAPTAGLTLDGTLTNNGTFTLESDASGTAWLDDFTLGGTVTGNISVQRYNPIGLAGFRQLGTPVAMPNFGGLSGFTVSGTPGQIIPYPTCDPNFVQFNSPYGNWMELAENNSVTVPGCAQSLFNVLTSGGMTAGRGYYMDVTGGGTLTFTGAPNTGTVSNTTPTWVNGAVSGGWNMVANPFPSPLRWEFADVPAGFDAIGKVWVTSGTYLGTWQDLDPSAGGTQAVSIGQGFQVKVSAPNTTPAFTVGNASRTTLPPTYLFSGSDPMTLNIDITGNGFADLTKVRFIEGATDTYDAMYDSPKMLGNAAQPMVYSIWNGQNMSTNSFNALSDVYTVPLGVKTGSAGGYDFTFTNIDQFPASAFIYLEDTQNGTMQDLRMNGGYSFSLGTGATDNRFLLHFFPPVKAESADADCENGASVTLTEQAPASWNYTVSDALNQTVASGQLEGTSVVDDLSAGTYTLTLTETTSGYTAQETFTVNGPAQVTAQASASVTVAEPGQQIQFTASAQNADTYLWSFGDGNTSADMNPLHLYNAPGNYAVTLTASNADCAGTDGLDIQVNGSPADVDDAFAQNGVSLWNDGNTVFIRFEQAWEGKTVFTLYDAQGRRILNRQFNDAQGTLTLDCGVLAAGTYTAELRGNGRTLSRKTVMGIK